MNRSHLLFSVVMALASFMLASSTFATETIRIGVLATLEGTYESLGREAIRGVETALAEFEDSIENTSLELIVEGTNGSPEGLHEAFGRLANDDKIELVIGPLTGYEGVTLRNIAYATPSITFINGSSASPDMTLAGPPVNLFRFTSDVTQWLAGLANFAYQERKFRRIVTVGEDFSFPLMQIFAFTTEFCASGGKVIKNYWLPFSDKRYEILVNSIKEIDADAIFLTLEGSDAVKFHEAYSLVGGSLPLIGGPVTIDEFFMRYASMNSNSLAGTLTSGPIPEGDSATLWKEFSKLYRKTHGTHLNEPSFYAYAYYVNARALFMALENIDADLSDNHYELREALEDLDFMGPTGRVQLDKNRHAITNNYLFSLGEDKEGILKRNLVRTVIDVDQRLGMSEADWLELGIPSRHSLECR